MHLIIGGKAQGKLTFAKKRFNLQNEDITTTLQEGKKAIYNLQDIIANLIKADKDAMAEVLAFAEKNDVIFICDEVGSGIVPMEAFERKYRDTVGKICCELAQKSNGVSRVFCGIGKDIK